MWLLFTFIIVWALSPGPVAVMTIHQARKRGSLAGVAVSGGATVTAVLMVLGGLYIHSSGLLTVLESDKMALLEQIGALGIVLIGIYAAYRCLWVTGEADDVEAARSGGTGFFQGMLLMATYIPQALIYYNVIVPQSVDAGSIPTAIMALGGLKVTLIFFWHAGIALVAGRAQNLVQNQFLGRVLEFALACLIVAMGVNIFV